MPHVFYSNAAALAPPGQSHESHQIRHVITLQPKGLKTYLTARPLLTAYTTAEITLGLSVVLTTLPIRDILAQRHPFKRKTHTGPTGLESARCLCGLHTLIIGCSIDITLSYTHKHSLLCTHTCMQVHTHTQSFLSLSNLQILTMWSSFRTCEITALYSCSLGFRLPSTSSVEQRVPVPSNLRHILTSY